MSRRRNCKSLMIFDCCEFLNIGDLLMRSVWPNGVRMLQSLLKAHQISAGLTTTISALTKRMLNRVGLLGTKRSGDRFGAAACLGVGEILRG